MKLLSLLVATALLLPKVVVGKPIQKSDVAAVGPTIDYLAKYTWTLIFDYDNSNNTGSIVHTYKLSKSGSYTSQTFNEAITNEAKKLAESGSISVEAGASYGPVSASVKAGYSTSKEVSSFLQETTREQKETTETYLSEETRQCK
ncbi:hypothetical protein C0991_006877 [Blastosporella zonata]|nr:hypothetical protein C0991_006877 [Blastosporella zonata]